MYSERKIKTLKYSFEKVTLSIMTFNRPSDLLRYKGGRNSNNKIMRKYISMVKNMYMPARRSMARVSSRMKYPIGLVQTLRGTRFILYDTAVECN